MTLSRDMDLLDRLVEVGQQEGGYLNESSIARALNVDPLLMFRWRIGEKRAPMNFLRCVRVALSEYDTGAKLKAFLDYEFTPEVLPFEG